jgi:hypothetical protein
MDDQPAMLGDRVREVVTGRTGLVTGFCEYLWGCEQLLVHIDGEKDKDGDTKTVWYDVSRLEVTERAATCLDPVTVLKALMTLILAGDSPDIVVVDLTCSDISGASYDPA